MQDSFPARWCPNTALSFRPHSCISRENLAKIPLCAESSDTSEKKRPRPSCSKDCAGWNIAATTARASPFLRDADLLIRKKKGKIDEGLARLLNRNPGAGSLGIGHTRWATHGPPSDENCHPHLDQSGKIAVVHNGVIENYDRLKAKLESSRPHIYVGDRHGGARAFDRRLLRKTSRQKFRSQSADAGGLRRAARSHRHLRNCRDLRRQPDTIVGARRGSPLIIGIGNGENFLASDANAIVAHTKQVVYLNDYDVATITRDRFDVQNLGTDTANVQISRLEFESEDAERGEFAHFMLKEIFEQPRTVENALRGRVDFEGATAKFGGLNMSAAELRSIDRIIIAASGTSWHAALVGEYLIEELAHIPVEVEFAHEFCYRNAPLEHDTVLLVISQSGETADTLAALREAKRRGHSALAIVNVVGSTIARESDGGIYMHAGPEIGVASTKAFVSTLTILSLLAVHLGRMRMLSANRALEILQRAGSRAQADRIHSRAERDAQETRAQICQSGRFLFPGPRLHVPDCARRRAQAEGNFLHPCRRLFRRGNEARPDCVD